MSEEKVAPKEFQPIEDPVQAEKLLREGAKSFAATMIWTKNQDFVIRTHMNLYSEGDKQISTWTPKDFDLKKFNRAMEKAGTQDCFFSVSLQFANIFFKSQFLANDSTGLHFHVPEKVFKVQRRKDLRHKVPDGQTLKIEFTDPTSAEKRCTKNVLDISAGGLSFVVPNNEASIYAKGSVLRDVNLVIRSRKITVSCEVRHIQETTVAGNPAVKIGLFFISMRAGDQQHIASYVFEESRKYFMTFI